MDSTQVFLRGLAEERSPTAAAGRSLLSAALSEGACGIKVRRYRKRLQLFWLGKTYLLVYLRN